jgi:hypothetical protein
MAQTKPQEVRDMTFGEDGPAITRNGGQLPDPRNRITRSVLHRILKKAGIVHNAAGTLDELMSVLRLNQVPLEPPPPGLLDLPESEEVDLDAQIAELMRKKAERDKVVPIRRELTSIDNQGYPRHIGKLKAMAKRQGIDLKTTDKRADIIAKLEAKHG